MKKIFISFTFVLLFIFSFLATVVSVNANSTVGAEAAAVPSPQKVFFNANEIAFDAYNINGNNYFKLRDLAYILNGTSKQFEVDWDEKNNVISLISDKAYTIVGGEMAAKGSENKTANLTTSKIYLDGAEVKFTAYNIENNNYFKLRDVMQEFDVYVDYDEKTNAIMLDTSKGSGVSIASVIPNQVIAAGSNHCLVIKEDGSLWAWGNNMYGQIGDSTISVYEWITIDPVLVTDNNKYTPVKIMDSVLSVFAGEGNSFAIKEDGSLWAWGNNEYGKLGNGTRGQWDDCSITPTKIMDDVVQVSAGRNHTMAIKTDGSLWAWGSNFFGQLGNGRTENTWSIYYDKPIKIMDSVVLVSTGEEHTMAIKTDGSLWAWGSNFFGQLGNDTTNDSNKPIKIMDDVIQVSAGRYHTMAIKNDGSLWAWGDNREGQLGDGTLTYIDYIYNNGTIINYIEINNNKYTPVKIMDSVLSVYAGYSHTMAIKNDDSLWAWGNNDYGGMIGDGTYENRLFPVKTMSDVLFASTSGYNIAIKSDHSLWTWGWINIHSDLLGIERESNMGQNLPIKLLDDIKSPYAVNDN